MKIIVSEEFGCIIEIGTMWNNFNGGITYEI